jgi:hypothetical protein
VAGAASDNLHEWQACLLLRMNRHSCTYVMQKWQAWQAREATCQSCMLERPRERSRAFVPLPLSMLFARS